MRENVTNHHRPCVHLRPGGQCVEGLLPAVYEAALVHSETHHSGHHNPTDQSTSAIIYVSIVVVFYVVIIAVLVGTTLRRRGGGGEEVEEETRHLLLYDEKTDSVTHTPAVPASRIHEAGLLTV
ncbi:uncharacterized protein [Procambarus clarkii]|uniref:uncharacterized protein n=1 Tax=Procambarus clarkii TaxID=6728 RepID=UPI003742561D